MITVRFPNGQAIQYNRAQWVHYLQSHWLLTEDEEKKVPIASIQPTAGVLVEFRSPCRVYSAVEQGTVEALTKEVRALSRKVTVRKPKK